MTAWDRRRVLHGLGAIGAGAAWMPPGAAALGLPTDKIKAVHYYRNFGDSAGRNGQPMVNQSTNVVIIETESGLRGIGEGGEPRTMEECAAMMIGLDPFAIDMHWQRMMRGMHYTAGREKLHSLGGLDLALWDLKGKALGVPVYQRKIARVYRMLFDRLPAAARRHHRGCGARLPRGGLSRLSPRHRYRGRTRSRPLRPGAPDV